jgi:hypothetical protein
MNWLRQQIAPSKVLMRAVYPTLPTPVLCLGYNPPLNDGGTLLGNIAPVAVEKINDFGPQDLSNIVWAFATLKASHPALFQSIGDVAKQKAHQFILPFFNQYEMNIDSPMLFNEAFTEALIHSQHYFVETALCQLHQWNLWQTKETDSKNFLPEQLH